MAFVEVVAREGRRWHHVSDGEGRFSSRTGEPMTTGVAWSWATGIGFGHAGITESPGPLVEADIVLAETRPQVIEVKFGSISPVRGALVEARLAGGNAPRSSPVLARRRCDLEGRCTLDLPSGLPIRLVARWPDGSRETEVVLEAAPGPDATVAIVFEPRSANGRGQIRGTVVDDEGRPLEGLALSGISQWSPSMNIIGVGASTDSTGAFRFEEGWEGEWWVKLRTKAPGDWIHAAYPTGRTGEETRIRAVRAGGVQVRVVPAEGAEPGSSPGQPMLFVLRYVPRGGSVPDDSWASLGLGVPKEGLLLPPGTWRFLLHVDGWQRRVLKEVDIESGKITDLGDVALAAGAIISGRISDPEGQPIRAGLVFIPAGEAGKPRPTERVGIHPKTDGSFSSRPDIPPGAGWLLATGEGFAPAARYLTGLPAGGTAEAGELRLSRGGGILLRGPGPGEVRVARVDGLPCAESIPARPWDVGPEVLNRTAVLDADGVCILEALPSGEYEARAGGTVRRFTVHGGGTTMVDLGGTR